uniref:Candidate secreted effector n=1 Tax=Meloidogyne incognita TaxID=6306 RepID=A0A914L0Q3_MELIC
MKKVPSRLSGRRLSGLATKWPATKWSRLSGPRLSGVVLSTEATGERGRQWQKMIQKPGKNTQYWHKLDVDE